MPTIAPALATFRAQLDYVFPTRSKASDGWIASAAHLDRTGAGAGRSQHNPDPFDVVCAFDVTEDLSVGLDCNRLLDELDALDDPRMFYAIHDRQIENSDDTRTPYAGSNPHVTHLHLSVRWQRPDLYNDGRLWALPILGARPAPTPPALVVPGRVDARGTGAGFRAELGNLGPRVRAMQAECNRVVPAYSKLVVDGDYGTKTAAVIREFAHRCGIRSADGLNVGPQIASAFVRHGIRA